MATTNRIKQPKKKTLVFDLVMILLIAIADIFFILHVSVVQVINKGADILTTVNAALDHAGKKPFDLGIGNKEVMLNFVENHKRFAALYIVIALMFILSLFKVKKSDWRGIEFGSAEWASKQDEAKFRKDKDGIVLGKGLCMSLDTTETNLNQFVIGGSGSRKTSNKIIPDILQGNTNYVITDPKGELYKITSPFLKQRGYKIKVLNLVDQVYSNTFNPFAYVQKESDILVLADTFLKNTQGVNSSDEFWVKAEFALLQSLMFYIYKEFPADEWNFPTVFKLLNCAIEIKPKGEELDEMKNETAYLDTIFAELEEKNPNHIALQSYKTFKMAAGETAGNIMVGLAVRFGIFTIEEVVNLTSTDEMEFKTLTQEKMAIFLIIPDTIRTYDLISAMFYSQLFQYIFRVADETPGGRLKYHVRCLLDEFYNVGIIPGFNNILSTARGRNVSITPVVQDLSQLKSMYKDLWSNIIANCDTLIFMGSQEQETREYISKLLGTTTIQLDSKNVTYGFKGKSSDSVSTGGRELMNADELRTKLDKNQSVVIILGEKPILAEKYYYKLHPNSKDLGIADYKKDFADCVVDLNELEQLENEYVKELSKIEKYLLEAS